MKIKCNDKSRTSDAYVQAKHPGFGFSDCRNYDPPSISSELYVSPKLGGCSCSPVFSI